VELVASLWEIAIDTLTLFLLENIVRNNSQNLPSPVLFFFFVLGFMASFDIFYNADQIAFDTSISWLRQARGLVFAAGAPFLLFAVLPRRGWKGEFSLSRNAIFHSSLLLLIGIYLVAVSFAGQLLHLSNGVLGTGIELAFLAVGTASVVTLARSASVRAQANVFIGKHFFRLKYDYREVWLTFIRHMAGPDVEGKLHDRTLRALADAIHCGSGALWILHDPIETYVGAAVWNLPGDLPPVPANGALPRFLAETGWVVDIEECLNDPGFYGGLLLPRWIERYDTLWTVVPLIHNRVLEGFIALGNPHSVPAALGWEELDLLKTVGAQAASYLAEERASRELTDSRRLNEFNRRFAFVVHDIKNVVSQMSLMLRNAERFGDDPEFQQDMLRTVGSAVERLNGMLVQLGNKPAHRRPEPQRADVGTLTESVAQRWQRSYQQLVYNSGEERFFSTVVSEKLVSAMDHLIQNAVDAAGRNGEVGISVTVEGDNGLIEITDNGPGMTSDFVRDQLFRPLSTSKPGGSGLGAFQALRLVKELGGALEVDTEIDRGTTMRIVLPRTKPQTALLEES